MLMNASHLYIRMKLIELYSSQIERRKNIKPTTSMRHKWWLNYKVWLNKEHNYVHTVFIKWSLHENHDMKWGKNKR